MKTFRSFQDLSKGLENNEFTCEELVNFYLKEIKTNDRCNSFVETFDESSIEQAKLVDLDISNNNRKKLSGLIIGIKDNMCYQKHDVTASSLILKDFKSIYSATSKNCKWSNLSRWWSVFKKINNICTSICTIK